jgi:hypothetical protein
MRSLLQARLAFLFFAVLALDTSCGGGSSTLSTTPGAAGTAAPASRWVTAWGAPMQALASSNEQTYRAIVKPTVGSRGTVRVHLSNVLGTAPITVGALHVGIVSTAPAVAAGSDVAITFSGAPSVTIPAGASLYSDPAKLSFAFGTLVAITTYVSGMSSSLPAHSEGNIVTEYTTAAGAGNETGDLAGTSFTTTGNTFLVDRLDLLGNYTGTVAFAGSSTTIGVGSTPNAYNDLVNDVATNLHAAGRDDLALANMAIVPDSFLKANDIQNIRSVTERLSDDFLSLPSLRTVVQNASDIDLKTGCDTATDIIAGEESFVSQVHAAGARAVLAVIAPATFCKGQNPSGFGSQFPAGSGEDAQRDLLNAWIVSPIPSTVSGVAEAASAADGYVDISTPVTDPSNSGYLLPSYDIGDDSHVTAAGQAVQAAAIPTSVL